MITRRHFLKLFAQTAAMTTIAGPIASLTKGFAANQQVPVLLYHRVGYGEGDLTVSPERFAADLRALSAEGYKTISLNQFSRHLLGQELETISRPVLITFDDGYRDNYEAVFPVLQRYGMTAAFFIITGLLDAPDRLTSSQMMEMAYYDMSIGSHTITHRPLGDLSEQDALQELTGSRQQLENILGRAVDFVAYPRGSYTADTLRLAKAAGYFGGFTTRYGTCSAESPHYTLRRIPVFRPDPDALTVIARRS
ncbi:MAG: polysaccharide deacetylase family protein [Negativicutes bacterium]|nr:polysaccharide deacetylase family protein [Negativicutes bacterium]